MTPRDLADLRRGRVRTVARWLDAAPDPLALYRRLTNDARKRNTILLESADATSKVPEQSLIVADAAVRAVSRGRRVTLEALSANGAMALASIAARFADSPELEVAQAKKLVLRFPPPPANADDHTRIRASSPLDVIRAMGQGFEIVQKPADGCLICAGVFAYDLLDNFEPLPEPASDPLGYPDFVFWLSESLIRIDHPGRRTQVACHVFGGDETEAIHSAYHDAVHRLTELVQACADTEAATTVARSSSKSGHDAVPSAPIDPPEVDLDDEAHAEVVSRLKKRIVAGDVFQIVPSRTFTAPCPDPLAAYEALRSINPSPYMFVVAAPDHTLFGASPETAVKVSNQRENGNTRRMVEIRPIAGTRPRGRRADGSVDVDLDNRLEVELRLHEKEVAEHMMLIDLARNDVARVCKPGTRHVDKILATERYSHVMHLVSNVTGELRDDLDALHAYQASMNMGTLVGAPKVRAAQILRETETTKRGPYGGAVGYLAEDGELDTAIIIRSAVVKDGRAYVRAGGGIVFDSDPDLEVDETRRKAASVLAALAAAKTSGRAKAEKDGDR